MDDLPDALAMRACPNGKMHGEQGEATTVKTATFALG